MNQSPSCALPDIIARRLMQEQELQIVIVNELMRRKLLERSSKDSHKFVLDRQHNASSKLSDPKTVGKPNSVFTGIIGKCVGHPTDSERGTMRTDANGDPALLNAKKTSVNKAQKRIKSTSNDKQRRDRLQDMLLAEESMASPSVSCDKKTISPRKERENLNTMMAPRRHVLKLNLGALISSPAAEHCNPSSNRGSCTERHSENSGRYEIAFTSARCTKVEHASPTLDSKPSSFECNSELDAKACEISETSLLRNSTTPGIGLNFEPGESSLGKYPCDVVISKRDSHRSKAVLPEISHILGSSVAPGFLRKVQSLRSHLANPVSCHLPTAPEHPNMHSFSYSQSQFCLLESQSDDWSALIAKYDSSILKSMVKTSND